jgi:hypothetical protein
VSAGALGAHGHAVGLEQLMRQVMLHERRPPALHPSCWGACTHCQSMTCTQQKIAANLQLSVSKWEPA